MLTRTLSGVLITKTLNENGTMIYKMTIMLYIKEDLKLPIETMKSQGNCLQM